MPNRRRFLRSALAAPLFSSAIEAQDRTLAGPPARANDPAYWAKVREQFPLARDKVFFNNGTIGAMPKPVVDRMIAEIHRMSTDVAEWDYRGAEWIGGYGDYPDLRGKKFAEIAQRPFVHDQAIILIEHRRPAVLRIPDQCR